MTDEDTALRVTETNLDSVVLLEPPAYHDTRGFFREIFNETAFDLATGVHRDWVQDNHSRSRRNVLRGIHYQLGTPQGKLVSCISGEIFDVAVDLRRSSPSFGRWFGTSLNPTNGLQLWIPEGFGHAFLTLSEAADVLYKVTAPYDPAGNRTLAWDDPVLGIRWPLTEDPILSDNDRRAPALSEAEVFP